MRSKLGLRSSQLLVGSPAANDARQRRAVGPGAVDPEHPQRRLGLVDPGPAEAAIGHDADAAARRDDVRQRRQRPGRVRHVVQHAAEIDVVVFPRRAGRQRLQRADPEADVAEAGRLGAPAGDRAGRPRQVDVVDRPLEAEPAAASRRARPPRRRCRRRPPGSAAPGRAAGRRRTRGAPPSAGSPAGSRPGCRAPRRSRAAGRGTAGRTRRPDRRPSSPGQPSILRAAMKADCGISTWPNCRIRFLPSFCFSSSFFLRVMSPP